MKKINYAGSYEYNKDFADRFAELFTAAGSDKATYHCYEEIYSHLLYGRDVKSFLEIGLFLNEDTPETDLHAWAEIFPDAEIFGADRKQHLLFSNDRIKTHYADQDDRESLYTLSHVLPKTVDVILDDASHHANKTMTTFEELSGLVTPGGLYLIEDILHYRNSLYDWEQNVDELNGYFHARGVDYTIYASSSIQRCVDSVVFAIRL
jgi:hypothetical protein